MDGSDDDLFRRCRRPLILSTVGVGATAKDV
jgi:hypothetical protein